MYFSKVIGIFTREPSFVSDGYATSVLNIRRYAMPRAGFFFFLLRRPLCAFSDSALFAPRFSSRTRRFLRFFDRLASFFHAAFFAMPFTAVISSAPHDEAALFSLSSNVSSNVFFVFFFDILWIYSIIIEYGRIPNESRQWLTDRRAEKDIFSSPIFWRGLTFLFRFSPTYISSSSTTPRSLCFLTFCSSLLRFLHR